MNNVQTTKYCNKCSTTKLMTDFPYRKHNGKL